MIISLVSERFAARDSSSERNKFRLLVLHLTAQQSFSQQAFFKVGVFPIPEALIHQSCMDLQCSSHTCSSPPHVYKGGAKTGGGMSLLHVQGFLPTSSRNSLTRLGSQKTNEKGQPWNTCFSTHMSALVFPLVPVSLKNR